MADPPHAIPRWVKVFGVIALAFAVLVVVVLFVGGGDHGPGRHRPGGEMPGNHAPPVEHGP